jgi:hypothetical protein
MNMNTHTQSIIELSLVMGAKPDEDFYSRPFYREENVMVLDRMETSFPSYFNENRFLHIDFTNINELKTLVLLFENQFQTICFDWSVWKFFVHCSMTIENCVERLNYLHDLLKPDGVLIIPQAFLMSMFAYPKGITPLNTSKEEILRLKEEAQNEHTEFIVKIFNRSNFFDKFYPINSKLVSNELFKMSTNLHGSYQTKENVTKGYDVLLARK